MVDAASLADWISAISQLLFLLIFLALFLGVNQRFQVYVWSKDVKAKLSIIEEMAREARKKTVDYMKANKARGPDKLVERIQEFFVIPPVDIEPVDIIKRLGHLLDVRRRRYKEVFQEAMPEADDYVRSRAETAAEITAALNFIYKYVRHLLILGEKTKNWILIMQLQLLMPQILRIADTYRRALDDFIRGVPVGDSVGPMVALQLAGMDAEWRELDEDTVYTVRELEGRRVYIVKARGPGSNVGNPGRATARLIRELVERGEKPSLLVTVDAALKLEGEETGTVADGVGAAIGDPGPEKISFERVAVGEGIRLRAVIVKMGMEEAILAMKKEIAEAASKAVERVREIIRGESREGDTVVVAGIGNTIGVA